MFFSLYVDADFLIEKADVNARIARLLITKNIV